MRMRRIYLTLYVLLFGVSNLTGQNITWTDISGSHNLTDGVQLMKGRSTSPQLNLWYLDVDMSVADIALRPYITDAPDGVTHLSGRFGAIAAINGGFFGGSTSYSAVVYPGELLAQNISALNRSGVSYPVTRSFFGLNYDREMCVDWIYHFGATIDQLFRFDSPAQNAPGTPAAVPLQSDGEPYENLWTGIGGGPTLIKNGVVTITYDEEVFWESGVGLDVKNPRTAVGHTGNGHAILLVVDGRQSASEGVTLERLANIMKDLGCVEAMNLDGGGSTQMAVGHTLINRPEGGVSMRAVPTILAVVHADSLPYPRDDILFENVIDTADDECTLFGDGWFSSANVGYWGGTKAMLNTVGDGSSFAQFRTGLNAAAEYEVHAWWVAAFNRCMETPYIVNHADGTDTVRVDQTQDHAKWNYIGTYTFNGDSSESVIISNLASQGTYIVADAIRFVSYDPRFIDIADDDVAIADKRFELSQNYPNPFNSTTSIQYRLSKRQRVRLTMHNILGKSVSTLVDEVKEAGIHVTNVDGASLASGIYLYRLQAGERVEQRKMIYLR